MARRYQPTELIGLRKSPLVCKPPGLPAIEEWMGPVHDRDAGQRRPAINRARTDDPASTIDAAGGRSTFLDKKHASRSSSNVPSDIVLGPPKTSFASASTVRNSSKTVDSPNRGGPFTTYDEFQSSRESHKSRDLQHEDGIHGDLERNLKNGTHQGRRVDNSEIDTWSAPRPRKIDGPDEDERPPARNGDRGIDGPRFERGDRGAFYQGFANHQREEDLEIEKQATARREGQITGRNELFWHRTVDHEEEQTLRDKRHNGPERQWRAGDRGGRRDIERDNTRRGKQETDPEWMTGDDDAGDKEQKKPTADDFKEFMTRMKEGKKPTEATCQASAGQIGQHDRTRSGVIPKANRKQDTPLMPGTSDDKFFGLWSEPKAVNDISNNHEKLLDNPRKVSNSKTSRFASVFAPQTVAKAPDPELRSPNIPYGLSKDSSSEDKEGFQRILQMLGKGNDGSGQLSGRPFANPLQSFQPETGPDQKRSPPIEDDNRLTVATPQIYSPRSRRSIGFEGILGLQSPPENQANQSSDSEFLLHLIQHKGGDVNQHAHNGNAPGIIPFSHALGQQPREVPFPKNDRGFQQESYEEDLRYSDKLNPTSNTNRIHPRGPLAQRLSEQDPIQRQQQHVPLPTNLGIPSGLQRPPGFEQPGFITHLPQHHQHHQPTPQHQNQQQHQNIVAPPPGFQQGLHPQNAMRNLNPNLFPPGLVPNLSSLNSSSQDPRGPPPPGLRHSQQYQQQQQQGMPLGMGSGSVGLPPGFMNAPPPGFMGPPPGFPPPNMDGLGEMGQGFGMRYRGRND
ncbi:hypothetical protein MMC09_005151 [Bachmanniomyces sp. S44760]|nr:hypothetical protein [Bachmanniomyces sp. S44760]